MIRYLTLFAATLAACFLVQSFALRMAGGRAAKSESNFFSSIGRIQAGGGSKVDAMILGSSMTGRLPDQAQGFDGWANMGTDGGSAIDALRAMDEGVLPHAPLLVIEANTLYKAFTTTPSEVSAAMHQFWFRVGMKIPNFSAYARPSSFLYSKLLAKKIGDFQAAGKADLGATGRPMLLSPDPSIQLTAEEEKFVSEVAGILQRLRQRGSDSVMVWLPPGRGAEAPPAPWILEIARRAQIPYWDLGQQTAPGTIILTDGVHMSAPSATRTMNTLTSVLKLPEKTSGERTGER